MKRISLIISFCLIAPLLLAQEQPPQKPHSPMPMLKDGSPAAYVIFGRPKRAYGLAMMNPEGSGYAVEPLQGSYGVLPAPDSKDNCIYFQTAEKLVVQATGTFFVTVSYFDRGRTSLEIRYYSLGEDKEKKERSERMYLGGSEDWLEHTFTLSGAVLDGSMEGADFCLYCPGVPIRAVRISRVPLGQAPQGPDTAFKQTAVSIPAGYTFGMIPIQSGEKSLWKDASVLDEKAKLFQAWGVPNLIDTVGAVRTIPNETRLDYSEYAKRAEILASRSLVWVPYIKIGDLEMLPAEAVQLLQRAQGTDRPGQGPMVSIFDQRLIDVYDKIFDDLRASTQNIQLPMMILSFAGDWGPLCLSWEGNRSSVWPDLWAGDPFAIEQFRTYLQNRYGNVNALNMAWSEKYDQWNQIEPSVSSNHSPQRIIETYTWYRNALTTLIARIASKANQHFSGIKLVIEVGDGMLYGATDLYALAQLASEHSWQILFTTSDPDPTTLTSWRMLAKACRMHNVKFGLRSGVTSVQTDVSAPLYSLVSEGGTMFVFEESFLVGKGSWDQYAQAVARLRITTPDPRVAVIYPRASIESNSAQPFDLLIQEMRKSFAFDVIDETQLNTVTASDYPLVIVPWGDLWTTQAVNDLERIAREGASLIAHCEKPWRTIRGEVEFNERMFPVKLIRRADDWAFEPVRDRIKPFDDSSRQTPVDSRALNMGSNEADPFLSGQWGQPQDPKAAKLFGFQFNSFRWLGEQGQVTLPMIPRRDYRLEIEGFLPKGKSFQVYLNRRPFGIIEGSGEFKWNQPMTGGWRPNSPNVEVQLSGQTWNPGEILGATQTFQAGMAVSRIAVMPLRDTDTEETDPGIIRPPRFSRSDLRGSWLKEVGLGVTLLAPAEFVNNWEFRKMLNAVVSQPALLDPKYEFFLPVVDSESGIYVSPQRGTTLFMNVGETPKQFIWGIEPLRRVALPPHVFIYEN